MRVECIMRSTRFLYIDWESAVLSDDETGIDACLYKSLY